MNNHRKQRIIAAVVIGTIFGTGIPATVWAQRGDRDQDQRYEQKSDKDQKQDQRRDRSTQQPQTQQRRTQQPRTQQRRTQQPRTQQRRTQQPRTRQPQTQQTRDSQRSRETVRNRELERERYTRSRTAPPPRGYVLDPKYRHNRYYPPRGYVTPRLPSAYRQLTYKNRRYYYHGGVWYRRSTSGFIVVLPPIGVAIPILPPFYVTLWVGGVPYYYANGIYYVWYPAAHAYVVTNPPPESAVTEEPTETEELFVYPMHGQSEQQQAADRYQCHRWAFEQTGFDPTRAGGGVSSDEYFNKRDDYHRAITACLEARGYSVK